MPQALKHQRPAERTASYPPFFFRPSRGFPAGTRRHDLIEIIASAVRAVIGNADPPGSGRGPRACEGQPPRALPRAGQWHPSARHLQPRLRPPRPARLAGRLPEPGPRLGRRRRPEADRHRRQGAAASLRPGRSQGGPAPRPRPGVRGPPDARPGDRGRQVGRGHRRPEIAGGPRPRRGHRHQRRYGLPEGQRRRPPRRRGRLRAGPHGQPRAPHRSVTRSSPNGFDTDFAGLRYFPRGTQAQAHGRKETRA
jgi:hypothetical protein